jgi:hypothetical protein
MILRNRLRQTRNLFRLGAACLLLANLSRWFVHPAAKLSQGIIDGATGMLFGLAIGLMLWAIIVKSRQQRSDGGGACAS